MRAVVTLVSFLGHPVGPLRAAHPALGGRDPLPGYMVWAALAYAIAGTWLTNLIGRPLVRLNFNQQRYEADFRFSLVRFRENTEGVALYRGEADEMRNFRERFGAVVGNWWDIMRQQKRLTWFTAGYGQAAIIFPILVAAPRYFRGEIALGGLMQTSQAFGQVQDSLSLLHHVVHRHRGVARGGRRGSRASSARSAARARGRRGRGRPPRRGRRRGHACSLDGRDLALPGGRPLMENVSSRFARRHRADQRAVRRRQEHAVPGHRGHLAVRARRRPPAAGRPRALPAPEALPADRDAPRGGELSDPAGRGRGRRRCARP